MDYGQHILDFEGQRIIGVEPYAVLESNGEPSFWDELRCQLEKGRERYPEGGAIGFVGYEATRSLEPRAFPIDHRNDLNIPCARLVFFKELKRENGSQPPFTAIELHQLADEPAARNFYQPAVRKIKEYIAAGDIYQANLTYRVELETLRTPDEIYARLQSLGKAPRAALLKWNDFSIVSNSPETFLTLKSSVLEARPIKGTISRGATVQSDALQKQTLAKSLKDKAENVMIVDLMRNDLGRVCEYGSVTVPSLYQIETFPTLHHGVSIVQGHLRPDCDAVDAFLAAFPCGSITGAPKMRAMQILNELETVPRGVSMGAIGYFGFDGDMEWSVAIRTATLIGNRALFHVGGGIVADSEPESGIRRNAIESAGTIFGYSKPLRDSMMKDRLKEDLKLEHLTAEMLLSVPETQEDYAKELVLWKEEEIPPHILYGSVLSDFIRCMINDFEFPSRRARREALLQSFALIERMASSSDYQVRNVIEVSVLESLLGQTKEDWALFSSYFGKNTMVMARKLA